MLGSSPAVAGGAVYVHGHNGKVYTLNAGAVTVVRSARSDKDRHGPHDPAPGGDGQRSDRAC